MPILLQDPRKTGRSLWRRQATSFDSAAPHLPRETRVNTSSSRRCSLIWPGLLARPQQEMPARLATIPGASEPTSQRPPVQSAGRRLIILRVAIRGPMSREHQHDPHATANALNLVEDGVAATGTECIGEANPLLQLRCHRSTLLKLQLAKRQVTRSLSLPQQQHHERSNQNDGDRHQA